MKVKPKKIIVIGLDGFETSITESMMKAAELPALSKLRQQGGYARLKTTYPAQTPVAWSTFTTGTNPGGHGIFDFLGRDPSTYLPQLALSRYEQKSAFLPPQVVNMRRGRPVWNVLSEAGIPSTVIRCPCTFPPDKINGRMLAGVGVPDLRGGLGTSTFYTSVEDVEQQESEKVVNVRPDENGRIITYLIGPRDPRSRSDFRLDIKLNLKPESHRLILSSDGEPKELEIREGQWSDWLKVKFKTGMLQSAHGILRFYLVRQEPAFELYASPINFDAETPLFPISSPAEYAAELSGRLGTFYTIGMAEDHDGLIHERFDETAYLDQCNAVIRERVKMLRYELERFEEGLLFCLFDTPDRLQHMFWRFREQNHPANRDDVTEGMSRAIEDHYRTCDRIVGRAMQYADDETLFIVLSDHGMSSFQRGFNLNTWLYENGFLALKNGIRPGDEAGDFFHGVDWDRTQAYALGLGGIYLNLKGREQNGIVELHEAGRIKENIIKGLTGLRDPQRGEIAVQNVVSREQIYSGPFVSEAPDLLANFSRGYRVSWGTPLGGVPEGLFEDNVRKWGGDHMIDPTLVPGVLFMNRPFKDQDPSLVDLAPSILSELGVPKGPEMEGESLLP